MSDQPTNKPLQSIAGYISILGRPNVGKSSLLNKMIGQRLSIISPKPQTTRHRILGIKSTSDAQMIFVDTPGFHLGESQAINRYMNRAAISATKDIDMILFVVQALKWTKEDEALLNKLPRDFPVIAVINKIDLVSDKEALLPMISELSERFKFQSIIPVSAKTAQSLDALEEAIIGNLPVSPFLFDKELITDRNLRFIAAERIREKLFLYTEQEIPYALSVEIESFQEEKAIYKIGAVIWVSRDSQKGIIIGHKGGSLKKIGEAARKSMEQFFGKKVYLQLWVRVKTGWTDDNRMLNDLGYTEN